jgi:hypothetical protein
VFRFAAHLQSSIKTKTLTIGNRFLSVPVGELPETIT